MTVPAPEQVARWDELLVTRGPAAVYWGGRRLDPPSPVRLALLFALTAAGGEAKFFDLTMATALETRTPLTVNIAHLRRWLVGQNIPVVIQCIVGFGYRMARSR